VLPPSLHGADVHAQQFSYLCLGQLLVVEQADDFPVVVGQGRNLFVELPPLCELDGPGLAVSGLEVASGV